jgi:hypothetical protein
MVSGSLPARPGVGRMPSVMTWASVSLHTCHTRSVSTYVHTSATIRETFNGHAETGRWSH